MIGLSAIVGHLVGDFLLQNDWMAKWKSATVGAMTLDDPQKFGQWKRPWYKWRPFCACTIHCLIYTAVVWGFCCQWMPWWGAVIVLLTHWPIDRFRLARQWMRIGQEEFATGPLSPWSVVIVDQTFHIGILHIVALLSGVVS